MPLIRDAISEGQNRVDAFDAEIRILKHTLAQLVQKREAAAAYTREHRVILPPVRYMPRDLVLEIFGLTIQGNDGRPGSLASWSCLPTLCSRTPSSGTSSPVPRLCLPGTVTCCPKLKSNSSGQRMYRWMSVGGTSRITMILPGCLSIRVNFPHEIHTFNWLNPLSGRLDRLEKLDLANAPVSKSCDIFSTAPPKLHEVVLKLDQRHLSDSFPIYRYSLDADHSLSRTYPHKRQLEILGAAPQLVECTVGSLFEESVDCDPYTNSVVALLHLRKLHLKNAEFLRILETAESRNPMRGICE
ncbi:hypothetical protein B0H14DRAFT_3619699 [Mycena olivaceomarginata]|nr:hypothetical protein B0H14DRAFT_3619699 [Mycena olivaceomarginata]